MSYGASFIKPSQYFPEFKEYVFTHPLTESVASASPVLTRDQAIAKAEAATGGKYNSWPTSLEVKNYLQLKRELVTHNIM